MCRYSFSGPKHLHVERATFVVDRLRALVRELGAEVAIGYREEDFVAVVEEVTDGHGADVILDNMGAAYLARNVTALADKGRLVIIGMQGGTKAELDINALLRKRGEILSSGGGVKPLQTSMENNSRQGDLADQASGNNEVHIQLKLKQTDAKILQAIEEALYRMEKGTYGVCRDCGEPIAPARLNAIPWTRVCITCKEKQSS